MTRKAKSLELCKSERTVAVFLALALRLEETKAWAVKTIDSWSYTANGHGLSAYKVACELQPHLAKALGWKVCAFCEWAEDPAHLHEYCREQLSTVPCPKCSGRIKPGEECQTCKEIAAAWDEWDREKKLAIERDTAEFHKLELEEGPQY